jgi:hypothetical protein
MDPTRFDSLTRMFGAAAPRRALIMVSGGLFTRAWGPLTQGVAAGCKKAGKKCGKKKCCSGARCRHGKCRCRKGWDECNGDKSCQNLSGDNTNCGACGNSCSARPGLCEPCGQPCAESCCIGGTCRLLCDGECCADCFVESDSGNPGKDCGTEACCPASQVCKKNSNPADDRCCWPNEVCLDGECCCDGCMGTKPCGGTCCPSVSCCNGQCCGAGQVCAQTAPNAALTCINADRDCDSSVDCFAGEECRGGTCCSGDRACFANGPNTAAICCALGHYCDLDLGSCCAIGKICHTGKKVRIRY